MKQTINNDFSRQFLGLGIVSLMIIFTFGCGGATAPANSNSAANTNGNANQTTAAPAAGNTAAPTSAASQIEPKAQAIVGKWETTTALDDKIAFDFGQPKKEGETYVGTYKFIVNDDTSEPPAKYIVSGDKMIKFFNKEGKEYPLIKVSVSDDGKTLTYFDQKDGQSKLTKVTDSAKTDRTAETRSDCKVTKDNADFFVEATEKSVKLKKGTLINVVSWDMHQGLYAVKANINGKWERGEINVDLIDCPDK